MAEGDLKTTGWSPDVDVTVSSSFGLSPDDAARKLAHVGDTNLDRDQETDASGNVGQLQQLVAVGEPTHLSQVVPVVAATAPLSSVLPIDKPDDMDDLSVVSTARSTRSRVNRMMLAAECAHAELAQATAEAAQHTAHIRMQLVQSEARAAMSTSSRGSNREQRVQRKILGSESGLSGRSRTPAQGKAAHEAGMEIEWSPSLGGSCNLEADLGEGLAVPSLPAEPLTKANLNSLQDQIVYASVLPTTAPQHDAGATGTWSRSGN